MTLWHGGPRCAVVLAALGVASSAMAQAVPKLAVTRELRIDAGEQELSPVSWIAVAPNGTIVVNQAQDGQIRFFDARGGDLGTFGRKGQGPGEFQNASRVGWIGDTLWVGDFSTRRFTLISPDRKLVRTTPWIVAAAITGELPGIAPPEISSVTPYVLLADGSQVLAVYIKNDGGTEVPRDIPMARVNRDGRLVRQIGVRPEVGCTARAAIGRGGFMVAAVPYCALVQEHFAPNGSRWAIALVDRAERASYRVSVVRTTGETVFNRLCTYRPVPLPRAKFDSVIARRTARGSAEAIAMWRSMSAPASYPPLQRILLGRDETTWLEEYTIDGDRHWLVLNGLGDRIGRVTVPRNVSILAASRESLWGTDTDEDGLQHIVRYRVRDNP